MSQDQVEYIKRKIINCDNILSGQIKLESSHDWGNLVSRNDLVEDREAVKIEKIKSQRILAACQQPNINERDRDKLKDRKEEIEVYLKKRLSAIGDEWERKDTYEFNKTVLNRVKYEEDCGTMELELKNINKILSPEDKQAGNLGYLYSRTRRNS